MEKQLTETTSIGKFLCKIAEATCEERKILMGTFSSLIENHPEEHILTVLAEHAKYGAREANIGKTIPPDLSKEEINFKIMGIYTYATW